MKSIYQSLTELETKNEPAALCTVVRASGSTPRHSASKMLIYEDGSFTGTIGGGELENRVYAEAMEAMNDGSTPEENPDAEAFYPVPMEKLTEQFKVTNQTCFVLATRGVVVDAPGLPSLFDSPAAYIGVIGSKRRWKMTVDKLREMGVPEGKLARVHSPIGLELQAETPEEIAVSIMDEILMLRGGGSGKPMKYDPKAS